MRRQRRRLADVPRSDHGMETVTSDENIVERALTGDAEAFGEIVRRWERRIFALAYGMLGREEDARDATQETFLAAFRNLRGFRGEAKFRRGCIGSRSTSALRGSGARRSEAKRRLKTKQEKNAGSFAAPLTFLAGARG